MSRIVFDETWEKQSDGTMKLVDRVEREISDGKIAASSAPEDLRKLLLKPSLSTTDLEKAVRALTRMISPLD